MRIGVLVKRDSRLTVGVQVALAVAEFGKVDHTKGHLPAEVHFHPSECPEALDINGLTVVPNEAVKPGHVRVTTVDETPFIEFNAERAAFDEMLASLASLR